MLRHLLLTLTMTGSLSAPAMADCVLRADTSEETRDDLAQMLFEPQLIAADASHLSWEYGQAFPGTQSDRAPARELDCSNRAHRRNTATEEEKSAEFQVRFVSMPDYAPVEWKDVPAPDLSKETPGLAGMVPIELERVPAAGKAGSGVTSLAGGELLSRTQHSARVKVTVTGPGGSTDN
ncbi:hypothetical protein [Roseibium sp. M-1]